MRKVLKVLLRSFLVIALVASSIPLVNKTINAEEGKKDPSIGEYIKLYDQFNISSSTNTYFKTNTGEVATPIEWVQVTIYSYNQTEGWIQLYFNSKYSDIIKANNYNPSPYKEPYGIIITGGSGTKDDPYTVEPVVNKPIKVTSITFDPTTIEKTEGDADFTLSPTIAPTDAHDAYKVLEYTSSDENVVTVDSSGNVHIVGAGTATITAKSKNIHGDTEDDVTSNEVTITVNPSITKVKISGITASDKVYDGKTDATLNFSNVVIDGKADGDDVSVTAKGTFADENVGTNKIVTISDVTLSGNDKDKYSIDTENVQKTTTASITPLEATLSWSDTELTYSGEPQKPIATVTNLLTDDTCDVTVTGEQTNAGTYTATASSLSNSNYKLPSNNTSVFTIKKAKALPEEELTDGEKPTPINGNVYDNGKEYDLVKDPSVLPSGYTDVEYSTDGGKTWSTDIPKGVGGDYEVNYKYTSNNYEELVAKDVLKVTIKNEYYVESGDGFVWTRGSSDGSPVTFKARVQDNQTFDKTSLVYVDNKVVTLNTDYTSKEGSLIITLKQSLLSSLADGNHQLKVVFKDEASVTSKFTVKTPSTPTPTPTPIPTPTPTPQTRTYVTPKTGVE